MKNQIIIDVDTDNELPIRFAKPSTTPLPETKEEAAAMVINDIGCLSEAIATLILMAGQNGYGDAKELVAASNKTISSVLDAPAIEPDQTESNGVQETN